MKLDNVCKNIGIGVGVMVGVGVVGGTLGASSMVGVYFTQRGIKSAEKAAASFAPTLEDSNGTLAATFASPQTYATLDSSRVSIESHETQQPAQTIDDAAALFAAQPSEQTRSQTQQNTVDFKGTVKAHYEVFDETATSDEELTEFGESVRSSAQKRVDVWKKKQADAYRDSRQRRRSSTALTSEQKQQLSEYVERQHEAIEEDHARRGIVETDEEKRFN